MRISCDNCGAVFDSKDHAVCPTCGAAYGDSPEVKDVENYEKKKREYDLEQQREKLEAQRIHNRLINMQAEDQAKRNQSAQRIRNFSEKTNKGCGGILIACGLIFLFFVAVAVKMGFDGELGSRTKYSVETTTEEQTTEVDIQKAEGNFGEEIDTGRYTFKIDKIIRTSAYPWNNSVGHSCILVHALFTNNMLYHSAEPGNVYTNIVAGGIAQKEFWLPSGYDDFPNYVQKNLTVEGWFKYEIPDDANDMEFRFGDYVVCHFDWSDVSDS